MKKILEPTTPGVTQTPYVLTPEEEADLDASLAEAERGEFATDEEVLPLGRSMGCESPLHAPGDPVILYSYVIFYRAEPTGSSFMAFVMPPAVLCELGERPGRWTCVML